MERTREQMRGTGGEMTERGEYVLNRALGRGGVSLMGMYVPWSTLLPAVAGAVTVLGIAAMYYFAPQTSRQATSAVRERLSGYGDQLQSMTPRGDGFGGMLSRLFGESERRIGS